MYRKKRFLSSRYGKNNGFLAGGKYIGFIHGILTIVPNKQMIKGTLKNMKNDNKGVL